MSTKAPSALHTDTSSHPSLSCIADFSCSTCCYADAPSRTHIYNALLTTSLHITEVAILILLHLVLFSILVVIYGIGPPLADTLVYAVNPTSFSLFSSSLAFGILALPMA